MEKLTDVQAALADVKEKSRLWKVALGGDKAKAREARDAAWKRASELVAEKGSPTDVAECTTLRPPRLFKARSR